MNASSSIQALIFDVGGVLIDVDFNHAFAHWSTCAGVQVDRIAARFKVDAAYEAHERGELDAEQYFAALRVALGIDIPDDECAIGWNAIFRGVYPGAAELLTEVATVMPVYLFSNTNALHYACWSALYPQVIAPVTRVFCSQEIGLRKPSIASFEKVCELIGVAPEHIVFFDDLADNIAGAQQAGWQALHVAAPGNLRELTWRALSG